MENLEINPFERFWILMKNAQSFRDMRYLFIILFLLIFNISNSYAAGFANQDIYEPPQAIKIQYGNKTLLLNMTSTKIDYLNQRRESSHGSKGKIARRYKNPRELG